MKKLIGILMFVLLGITSINGYAHSADDDGMLDFTGLSSTSSGGGIWKDQYKDPLVMPHTIKKVGEKVFIFSPKAKQWAAYDPNGMLVGYGRANGGGDFCEELGEPCHTPQGKFRVYRKGTEDCVSNTFPLAQHGGAGMPFCMFFSGGNAIHGSPQISKLVVQ
jgi:hypothetical protein